MEVSGDISYNFAAILNMWKMLSKRLSSIYLRKRLYTLFQESKCLGVFRHGAPLRVIQTIVLNMMRLFIHGLSRFLVYLGKTGVQCVPILDLLFITF